MKHVKLYEQFIDEASVRTDKYGNHLEPQFKKGDKITYHGAPGKIDGVNKGHGGKYTYDVSYKAHDGKLSGYQTFVDNKSDQIELLEGFINEASVSLDKSLHAKILKFIDSIKTYMDVYDEDDLEEIMLNTRENGDVGSETTGREDIKEAQRVQKLIKKKFPDLIVSIEEVDEWVHLNIQAPKVPVYKYRYRKADPKTGQGFSETFNTFDDMLKKRKTFVEGVDWKDVKKKLDKITDYPENEYDGTHASDKIVISKVGDEGNDWGYDFYVYKLKEEE